MGEPRVVERVGKNRGKSRSGLRNNDEQNVSVMFSPQRLSPGDRPLHAKGEGEKRKESSPRRKIPVCLLLDSPFINR